MGLQALFSSPLRRARETAGAIAAVTGLPVLLDDRLRERLNWDGTQTFGDFRAGWDRSTRDRDFVLGNGESSRSAGERMAEGIPPCAITTLDDMRVGAIASARHLG
jgi:broad specificity phosphatase PhoE